MNLEIKKRIHSVGQPEIISIFFELLNTLIDDGAILNSDERLSITLRNDNLRRFSVNINSRLVLSIVNANEFAMMINYDDMDKISNVPLLKTEKFSRSIPATLLYFNFESLIKYKEILKPLWLRSCLSYLPSQDKSQYRRHHVEELYNIAVDNKLLERYFSNTPMTYSNFQQIIFDFKEYLKNEKSIIRDYNLKKVYDHYVWIKDNFNIIGKNGFCHYEIITRKQHPEKIWIELHFDKKIKTKIKKHLASILDDRFFWNNEHGDELSLALKATVDFSDQDILSKLAESLTTLENTFGETVRQYYFNHLHTDDVSYVIIDDYKKWYVKTYQSELLELHSAMIFGCLYQIERQKEVTKFQLDHYDLATVELLKNKIPDFNYEGLDVFEKFLDELLKNDSMKKNDLPLNQILYGPPGTGKTYHTINKAISIINPDFNFKQDRTLVKKEYDRLVEDQQIVFTTFHQSMSYEDFVEGIKPKTKNENVTYSIEDGVFKTLVKKALSEYIIVENEITEVDGFDALYSDYIASIKPLQGLRKGTFQTKTGIDMMLVEANEKSILVKYLWDNNKTKNKEAHHVFTVSKEKLKKVLQEGIDPSKVKSLLAELHPLIGHIHCELFAVYKSFYEFTLADKGDLDAIHFNYVDQSYAEVKDQFDLLEKQSVRSKNVKPYVLIIDEINRGNVSQIFGELITLIEESKRLGAEENLEVILPYSKKKFGVPANLYIIGTMNTADRSVEALDTALRRRFCFEEMLPNTNVLVGKLIGDISLKELLEIINKRIEILLDRDHTIGHSYFVNITSEKQLTTTFKNNIIPLLQEYFYGDYDKIGMILGNGFFEEPQKYTKDIFANYSTQNYPESGSLKNLKTIHIDFNIIDALEILMKKKILVDE